LLGGCYLTVTQNFIRLMERMYRMLRLIISLLAILENFWQKEKKLHKVSLIQLLYLVLVMVVALALATTVTCFAAGTNDPLTVINNLSDFMFGIVRAIGMILLGFGIVQIGLSLKSHDPSQRANGFLTLAGGVIITFAKEILLLITGG